MSFPGNSTLIDDFTGGLGSRWTSITATAKAATVSANGAISTTDTSGSGGFFYYNGATYAEPIDVYSTFVGDGGTGNWVGIGIFQGVGSGATVDGYLVYFEFNAHIGGNVVSYWRIDNGVYTQLGADEAWTYNLGDSLGLQRVGTALNIWVKKSGVWTQYSTRTDSTYSGIYSVGYDIARDYASSGQAMDDLSGGTVSAGGSPPHRLIMMGCGI